MLLAIDAGNTQTVIGLFEGEKLLADWRLATRPESTSDECYAVLAGLAGRAGIDLGAIRGYVVSSVVPPLTRSWEELPLRSLTRPPLIVSPDTDTGIVLLVDFPDEVGPDRLVNAVAAHHLTAKPSIVVDFGTATTFDAISERGEYLGGAIAPGVEVSTKALYRAAARLHEVQLVGPTQAVGKTTRESLLSGVVYGFAGQVDGLVTRMAAELGWQPEVMATGGLAALIVPHCGTVTRHEPFLTLLGLRMIFDRAHA